MSKVYRNIKIEEDSYVTIMRECRERNRSVSDVIREKMRDYNKNKGGERL